MAGKRWSSEELVLLARAFAEVGSPSATSAQKLVGVMQVYPVFVRLTVTERTKYSVEATTRSMLRARTIVLSKYTWPEWLALSEAQRLSQARQCPATYKSILMRMNQEVFQVLDEVAAHDPQVPNTTASTVPPVAKRREPNPREVGGVRELSSTGEEDFNRIISVLSDTVPRVAARHMDGEEIHAALLEAQQHFEAAATTSRMDTARRGMQLFEMQARDLIEEQNMQVSEMVKFLQLASADTGSDTGRQ